MKVGLLAFVTFGALTVGSGLAQSSVKLRGNGGRAPGCLGWLSMPSVQAELKLDPEHLNHVRAIARDLDDQEAKIRKTLGNLTPQERAKALVALADDQYTEGMKALETFLKPEQVDRFDQILFQRRGASAMLEPDMTRTLKLTELQTQLISDVVRQGRDEQRKIFRSTPGNPKALEEKERANARDHDARAVAFLTEEQRKTWEQISGPRFEKPIGEMITP